MNHPECRWSPLVARRQSPTTWLDVVLRRTDSGHEKYKDAQFQVINIQTPDLKKIAHCEQKEKSLHKDNSSFPASCEFSTWSCKQKLQSRVFVVSWSWCINYENNCNVFFSFKGIKSPFLHKSCVFATFPPQAAPHE